MRRGCKYVSDEMIVLLIACISCYLNSACLNVLCPDGRVIRKIWNDNSSADV